MFTITKVHTKLFNNEDIASYQTAGLWNNRTPEMNTKFKAYDDDGNWYLDGLVEWEEEEDVCKVADFFAADLGCTQIKLYDLDTGKYIDEIS